MLTVLFATKDRASILREVLQAYCNLQPPASGWKLVVVDNGSVDSTEQVITSFSHRLPLLRVFEREAGKNRALNAALGLVEGELTVLTDDDAFPRGDWLIELHKAARAQPECSIFGGAIMPRWETPPPRWVQWIDPRPVFTLTDPALKEGPLSPGLVFGPNMAIRTDIFRAGLHFDTAIGPKGTNYPMGSETELVQRLGLAGHKAWYVSHAVVEHFIRKEQLQKAWVLERAIRYGRGKYRLLYAAGKIDGKQRVSGLPRLSRQLLREGVIMAASGITFRQESLFRSTWRFNYWRGQLTEARILARGTSGGLSDPAILETRPPA
jgi:L-malate glycosyltransferase